MLKLANNYPTTSDVALSIYAEEVGHIVVLLSTPDADIIYVTGKVLDLAQSSDAPVRLIGLCHDTAQEPEIRRALVTMSSLLNHSNIPASIEVLVGNDWLQIVMGYLEPHDIVVCWDEPGQGMWKKPFSVLLQSHLNAPVYILSTPRQITPQQPDWARTAAAWLGFLAITMGFLLLQVKIYQLASQWTITLEILSTACEFWLIWNWNN